jgi:hypothetical protein
MDINQRVAELPGWHRRIAMNAVELTARHRKYYAAYIHHVR